MKVSDLLQEGFFFLDKSNVENANLDARILLQHTLGMSREEFFLNKDLETSGEVKEKYFSLLDKRSKKMPVAKIIGKKEFWGLDFNTSEKTLDPRPDSEILIEAVLDNFKKDQKLSFFDLGTGTGCLIISLLQEFKNAHGLAVDISSDSIKIAQKNAKKFLLSDRVKFQQNNWNENITEKFDIIICNPPYISYDEKLPVEVREYDPKKALFAENNGLAEYQKLSLSLKNNLVENGKIFFEIGKGQENQVKEIMAEANFIFLNSYKDLRGIERCLVFA